jgi:acyl-CoA synthetase (AMP-forming)/AMP-acid ligase II
MSALPTPGSTIPEQLEINAAEFGGQDAVIAPEGRLTWSELLVRVTEVADLFDAIGLRSGDRLGILLPNGLRWVVSALAAQSLGLIATPINTWSRSTELDRIATQALPRAVVSCSSILGRDPRELLAAAGMPVGVANPLAPFIGTVEWAPDDPLPAIAATIPSGAVRIPPTPDTRALLLSTSGSTSVPKMVPLLHGALLDNGRAIGARMAVTSGDRIWLGSPLFFSYGCANALVVALGSAATLCLQEGLDGDEALAFIERERCTVYYGFGPTTRKLVEASSFGLHDTSSLRTGTTGFTVEEKALGRTALGIAGICSVYGMTEAYGHSAMTRWDDDDDTFFGTQGRPLETQELRIADLETGEPVPPGEQGEIQLRGAVTPGYLETVADAFSPDGWLRTGDLGRLDPAGRLVFVDRMKALLKINGINVAPAEIESVLAEHPAVDQVYVFGEYINGDQVAVAAIVTHAGVDWDELRSELVGFVRGRAASYKVPARFVSILTSDIPTTDTGKVNKRALAEQLAGV